MGRSEISVTIDCPLTAVFDTYTQADPWQWSGFKSVRWVLGQPWEVDSRLRIDLDGSFGVVVDQVLTHFEPYKRVDFISYFSGVTLMSQVRFRALSDSQTQIENEFEFVGTFSRLAGLAVGPAIEQGARQLRGPEAGVRANGGAERLR